ncbi:FkbM family methyltransferase [Nocardioides sp. WV_118_6]|uniref:FkbM family methyltransferase n=1 Tax=Pimelobacter TaxID=2044 RepID=UPI001C03C595|nr:MULTISPECIES: FkbM family methyltransferase [Pimelobacter]UUW90060.1 FkbM family methyltransferase [Pimelobacter simplex]UUW93889.1 FkbM family methyltransferase [Pimelobacter simplex]
MTGLGTLASTAKRRVGWLIRDRFPFRPVVREVQGVELVLPWSHRLPDYAAWGPEYGQNLVELARLLAESAPLTVLDVGANVGDSAVQILHAADGKVLCIEADRAYLEFLHRNVDKDPRIAVVEALLTVDGEDSGTTAVRTGGTTRFVEGAAGDAMPTVSPASLKAEFTDFAQLRLVKSDTDGYDVDLVPAIAETWDDAHPVLFFEYDPYLTRLAGLDPDAVWPRLEALGYRNVAVWANGGAPLGQTTTDQVAARSRVLDDVPNGRARSRAYWDVAVVHGDDVAAQAAIDRLVPGTLA